jgi:hypothetical protein
MISAQLLITITVAALAAIGFLMAVCSPSSNIDLS